MNLKTILPLEKRRFVLSVGDEGAILTLINGAKLELRLFANAPTSPDLAKTLASNPTIPVYILVDVLDQAYLQHTLPPVSPLNIGKLVARRLEKDFAEQDIKAAIKLYREKSGRKDWNYLFVSVNNIPPFSDWIEAVVEAPNPFGGIYLLPIEAEGFLKKLSATNLPKGEKQPPWQVLVSHNRVGGFRQIVFKNNKVLFTRIAQPIGGLAPDVIAGNIEQETLNTVEYIRRLGFSDNSELDIYIIASEEVKAVLELSSLQARNISVLTPFDVATQLKLSNAAEKSDRFGDVVFATNFVASKQKNLKLNTPYTKKLDQLAMAQRFSYLAAFAAIPAIILMSVVNIFGIFAMQEKVDQALQQKQRAQQDLDSKNAARAELPPDGDTVVDVVRLNAKLTEESFLPFNFLSKFARVKGVNINVEDVTMDIEEDFSASSTVDAQLKALFLNTSGSLDRLLEDIDDFNEDIRQEFEGYEVTLSGLPGEDQSEINIDLGATTVEDEILTLEIGIKGPKPGAGGGGRSGRRRG